MKIIICGAGLSGRAIAEKLSQIGNEGYYNRFIKTTDRKIR